jgi:hypothetical protein
LAKAATTAGQQLERFAAMLWTKRQCDNPAGAAIAAFRRGWAPSDDGMAVVQAILRPPGKRRKPEPRRDPKRSDEYARARILFQRHRDLLRQHGIECVEGLLASPLYRELAQGVA